MSRFRKLKIYKKHQSRDWSEYAIVPEIRLEGKWLKELGFEIGKEIEIKQQKNKLTITLIDKKEKNYID
ncbi:SymE family type I addiction module toxin [Tenacibaculum amylolyticum]|uniref:SymE family type I addiction module toxin n=1 Tax=Tenacibaculum amylolyticum TaxID=104269 RepID=UPI0038B57B04